MGTFALIIVSRPGEIEFELEQYKNLPLLLSFFSYFFIE